MLYSGYGVASDGGGSWSCGNDSVRNVIIFGVDNSLSSHTDNLMNRFLILGEDPTSGINKSFDSPQKKFSINFSKARTKFCLTLHYNVDNGYLFVNGKEIYKFKADNKNANFPNRFCLRSISDGFHDTESREVSLGGNVYNFSVDYNAIDKPDILDNYKYLTVKNNIK